MGFSWLMLAIGIGARPSEFEIDTDTPDALCPELSMTRDAIQQRLGQLEVEGGGLWRGRYGIVHEPAGRKGDYVRLVIVDPTGKEQVRRELPMQGESCATLAQAIALVVDGFFRDFGQSPSHETVTPLPTESAPVITPPKPNPQTVKAPETPRHVPRESAGNLGFIVGGGYESVSASAAPELGFYVAITSRWRTVWTAAFPTARLRESYGEATAYLYPLPLRFSFAYTAARYRDLALYLGPELLLHLEHGSISGVSEGRSGWRATFGMGGRAGLAYWLSPRFAITTNASVDAAFYQSRRFLLVDEPILEIPRLRWAGTLELWGTIFP